MDNAVNKKDFKNNINVNTKAKSGLYDFNKVDVFDIGRARDNAKKHSISKVYDYADKVSASINEAIKKESERGNSKCNVYISLKDVFGGAEISSKEYSDMIDYIAELYSHNGYDISVCSSRLITGFPVEKDNTYLKVYVSW